MGQESYCRCKRSRKGLAQTADDMGVTMSRSRTKTLARPDTHFQYLFTLRFTTSILCFGTDTKTFPTPTHRRNMKTSPILLCAALCSALCGAQDAIRYSGVSKSECTRADQCRHADPSARLALRGRTSATTSSTAAAGAASAKVTFRCEALPTPLNGFG